MKKIHLACALFLGILFVIGCEKEETENPIIVEPQQWREIDKDSISSGLVEGFTIGANATEAYQVVQQRLQSHTPNVQVVSNIYHKMEDIAGKIGLYNALLFDEEKGTGTGVQLYFEDDRIKSIYTNDGKQLNSWPNNNFSPMRVNVGMEVSRVYPQLLALSSINQYARKFQRISLFSKNTNKDFDPAMARSPQWYFAHSEADGKQKRVHLYFEEGKLLSVVTGIYAPY